MTIFKLKDFYNDFIEFTINTKEEFLEVRRKANPIKEISWRHEGKEIRINIFEKAICFLCFSLNKIVLLFYNQPEFAEPNNLVVYNGDGTIFKIIQTPCFIHPISLYHLNQYKKGLQIENKEANPRYKGWGKFRLLFEEPQILKIESHSTFSSLGNLKTIDSLEHLIVFITEKNAFKYGHYYEERALNIVTGDWHPTFCAFHSPLENNGHGQVYD